MPFVAALAVLAASYGAGSLVTAGGRIGVPRGLRRALTVFAIGYGLLSLLALLLGQVGAFDRTAFEAIAIALAVPGAVLLARELRPLTAAWRRAGRERWVLAVSAAIVAFDAVIASAPPTSADAIAYHLVAPKLWFESGRMFEIWWDWTTFGPFSAEMHFAYADALAGGRAAMVVGAGLAGFSAMCVYGLARELAGARVAAWATLIWVGQGMFLWEATGAFVELPLAGLVALGAWHLAVFARSGRLSDCAWSGLCVGLAVGTKYHALVVVPGFLVAALAVAPGSWRRRGLAFGALALPVLIGLPWYVRNVADTGNPVYPLLPGIFGGKYWDATLRDWWDAMLTTFGVDGIWRLPVFPLEFVLRTDRYERGYSFSPALFLLAPIALAFARRWVWALAAALLAYTVFWWEGMQQITRYLLPVLPFAAVLAALAGVELWRRGGWPRALAGATGLVTAGAFLAMTGLFSYRLVPGVVGAEPEGTFVQRVTGTYDALHWLDTRLPPEGRVLVGMRNLYWLDRPYVRFTEPLFTPGHPTGLVVDRMRRYDVRYLAFFEGQLPPPLQAIRKQLKALAVLRVPEVQSRSLNRVVEKRLAVYEWCPAPARCGATRSPAGAAAGSG